MNILFLIIGLLIGVGIAVFVRQPQGIKKRQGNIIKTYGI